VHVNLNEATTSPNNQFVYQKGAWTLHMLRDLVGTDAFWRGIRLYYASHVNASASTDDLRRAMEQTSGQDLAWFFRQWLTRPGVPSVDGTWRYDAAAHQIVVTIRQTQAAEPYRLKVQVGVISTAGATPKTQTAEVDGRETTLKIPADAAPISVMLDPGAWLLTDIGPFSQRDR
jgi:aminopeptidase N